MTNGDDMISEGSPDHVKYPDRFSSFGKAYHNNPPVSASSEGWMAARAEREAKVITNTVETYPTGAVRDTPDGKPRYDLIDPVFLKRVASHLQLGAEHYGEHNWTKGIPSSRYLASLLRHVEQYRAGERDEDHLAAAVFNLMGLMRNETRNENHDLYDWDDIHDRMKP